MIISRDLFYVSVSKLFFLALSLFIVVIILKSIFIQDIFNFNFMIDKSYKLYKRKKRIT